jgi:type II secretory pathway pseudopilin PulG
MNAHKASSSRVLFLELILDLVIFAICAVICLQVFAEARREADRSEAITQLGIEAQEVAELFKSGQSDPESLAASTRATVEGSTLTWYYDHDLDETQSDKAFFIMTCVIDDSQPVKLAKISLNEGSLELFDYAVARYYPAGGDGA